MRESRSLYRLLLMLTCGVLSGVNTSKSRAESPQRPNIVFILMDDLGQRDLGCYGSTYYRTPNIDRLAKESARFTDAYAACHVCSPTRAAFVTGKYPARLNLTDFLPGRGLVWQNEALLSPAQALQPTLQSGTLLQKGCPPRWIGN